MHSPRSVLLVDDSHSFRDLMERSLRRLAKGREVFPMAKCEDAVEHLLLCGTSRPMPGLVLLDRAFEGGMDGFEALRIIRQEDHLFDLPVLIVSGSDLDEHKAAARAAGADEYLVKGGDMDSLYAIARRVDEWRAELSWRGPVAAPAEIVRESCVPAAVAVPTVDTVVVSMTAPRTADQKLVELTTACDFAGITVRRALNLRETDQVLDGKRRLVVRCLMALGWSDFEVQDYIAFHKRYLQERRAENARQPLPLCVSGALALK